jgi:hypothetical protein
MRLLRSGVLASLIFFTLFFATVVAAQEAPTRFEAGGNLMAVRGQFPSLGTGVEGGMNFGRHLSLDAAFDYLPATHFQTIGGFFGAKAGIRRQRFGVFGKVRPGFFSTSHVFRSSTLNLDTLQSDARFARLTQRALDLGGVVEFYPATHWLLRWDLGDTLVFQEQQLSSSIVGGGNPPIVFPGAPSRVTNNFQFSTSFRYRF